MTPIDTDHYSVAAHFKSISQELDALRDRVRRLISDRHWLTDGEWKESVLSMAIERHLPATVKVGRGFIKKAFDVSTQCDILLYRADCPLLFRDGPLVVVTPDAVVGVLEVKTDVSKVELAEALKKLGRIGEIVNGDRSPETKCVLGLFSFKSGIDPSDRELHKLLSGSSNSGTATVDLVCLGPDVFLKWWAVHPIEQTEQYDHWHVYDLKAMAAGYFIANVVNQVAPHSVGRHPDQWFPEFSKEEYRIGPVINTPRRVKVK